MHGFAPLSSPASIVLTGAASTGLRQAFALVEGALKTGDTVRVEARLARRPADEQNPEPLRRLGLTGRPTAERLADDPRGHNLDIET